MFPAPFKPSNGGLHNKNASLDRSESTVSSMDPISIGSSGPGSLPKTSRFSSLFQRDNTTPTISTEIARENEQLQQPRSVQESHSSKSGDLSQTPSPTSSQDGDPEKRRLFVENVAYAAKKQDIIAFFEGFKIGSIDIPKKRDGGLKGVAYVTIGSQEEANNAILKLNNTNLKGRKVRISNAKSSGGDRKSHSDKGKGTSKLQNEVPVVSAPIQQLQPAPVPKNMLMDTTSSLRKNIYDLACGAISRGEQTPDEIFCDINFNDEEKMMLRDFYFRQKYEQNLRDRQAQMTVAEDVGPTCSTHGLANCMECRQAMQMQAIHNDAQKENMHVAPRTAFHRQSASWDSHLTSHPGIKTDFPAGAELFALPTATTPRNAVYPELSPYDALRLYGPKFVKDNFQQENSIIHNSYIPHNGRPGYDNPFQRQNAVVSTQPGVKTHCAFFLRTGHCDFAQQGCKFSHELPPGGVHELTTQPPRTRVAPSRPSVFGPTRTGLTSTIYEDGAPRRAVAPKYSYPKPAQIPFGRGKGRGNPFLPLADLEFESDYQDIDYNYDGDGTFQEANQRPMNIAPRGFQRPPNRGWREVTSWRDNMKHPNNMMADTDGAADDEGSSSDLISLSSYNR